MDTKRVYLTQFSNLVLVPGSHDFHCVEAVLFFSFVYPDAFVQPLGRVHRDDVVHWALVENAAGALGLL